MSNYELTDEHTNFARLSNVLITLCADLFREALKKHVPPQYPDLYAAIFASKKKLEKILNKEQQKFLFPAPPAAFSASVQDFDISLLYALIRNVSCVPAPHTGWGKPVVDNPRDKSIAANVERVRLLRNRIVGHSVSGTVSGNDFLKFWAEIEDCVNDFKSAFNTPALVHKLRALKEETLDPANKRALIESFQNAWAKLKVAFSDLADIKKKLVHIFRNEYSFISKNPFDPNSSTDIAMVYTDLEIVNFNTLDADPGIETSTYADNFNDILLDDKGQTLNRIFFEGKAGSGKTVLACKLVTDWCTLQEQDGDQSKDALRHFDICIPISLHNVKIEANLSEVLANCVLGNVSGLDVQFFEEYVTINPEKVLLVLDGLDEYKWFSSFINGVVRNTDLRQCTVVVTSRPWALLSIRYSRFINRLVRVIGFDNLKMREYAQKVFRVILNEPAVTAKKTAVEFVEEIEKKELTPLAQIPLLTLFLCYLWKYQQSLPETEAGVYINIIKCFIGNYLGKKSLTDQQTEEISLDDIELIQYNDVLKTVGEIAYNGIEKKKSADELVFSKNELKQKYNSDHLELAMRIGFISQQRGFNPIFAERFLSFPHKTFQEFFMAFYLVELATSEGMSWARFIDKIREKKSLFDLENVFSFIIGLSSAESGKEVLNSIGNLTVANPRYKELAGRLWEKFHWDDAPFFSFETLEISDIWTWNESLQPQVDTIKAYINLKDLKVYSSDLSLKVWDDIITSLKEHPNMEAITLCGSTEASRFLNAVSKSLELKTLRLDHTPTCDTQKTLIKFPKLECLCLSKCQLSRKAIQFPPFPGLKELALYNIKMTPSDWKTCFTSLNCSPQLESLTLRCCEKFRERAAELPRGGLPSLNVLEIAYIEMTGRDWSNLLKSLNRANVDCLEIQNCSGLCRCQFPVGILERIENVVFFDNDLSTEEFERKITFPDLDEVLDEDEYEDLAPSIETRRGNVEIEEEAYASVNVSQRKPPKLPPRPSKPIKAKQDGSEIVDNYYASVDVSRPKPPVLKGKRLGLPTQRNREGCNIC